MKQRLGIAGTLLGDPELLILDEPTNGLDPAGMSDMRELITRVAARDRTVLVSSHILSELEQFCDWLFIIEQGRLMYSGRKEGFSSQAGDEILLSPIDLADLPRLVDVVCAAANVTAGRDGDRLVVPVDGAEARQLAAHLNGAAASAHIMLAEVQVRRPTLESNYLRMLEQRTPEKRAPERAPERHASEGRASEKALAERGIV
jgi:ABC-2 type transport system ATP-binding protein